MILDKLQNKLHRYTHLNPEREGSPTATSTTSSSSSSNGNSPSQDSVVSPLATRNISGNGDGGVMDFNNRCITPINFPDNDAVIMDPRMQTPVHTPVNNILGYGPSILSNHNSLSNMVSNNNNNGDSYNPTSFLPPYLTRHRADSSSSLASSVSDFNGALLQGSSSSSLRQQLFAQGNANGNGNCNEQSLIESFTPQFVKLIMEIYQLICCDPTVTPFDDNNPPSGILNKVAKISIEQAEIRSIEIGFKRSRYLLTLIRKRLLQEIKKNGYLSRNASLSELPPPIQFPVMTSDRNNGSNGNRFIEEDQQRYPVPDSFEATLLRSIVYQRTALLGSGYISAGVGAGAGANGDCSSISTSERFGRSGSNSAVQLQAPQLSNSPLIRSVLSETYDTRAPRNSSLRNDSTMFLLTPDLSETNLSSTGDMIRPCSVLAKSASGAS